MKKLEKKDLRKSIKNFLNAKSMKITKKGIEITLNPFVAKKYCKDHLTPQSRDGLLFCPDCKQ